MTGLGTRDRDAGCGRDTLVYGSVIWALGIINEPE